MFISEFEVLAGFNSHIGDCWCHIERNQHCKHMEQTCVCSDEGICTARAKKWFPHEAGPPNGKDYPKTQQRESYFWETEN